MNKLTDAKRTIFEYIAAKQAENGYPPTVREICEGVGLASPASVHRYLRLLADDGLILYDSNKKRSYRVCIQENRKQSAVPLLGKVAAGLPILAHENTEDAFPIPDLLRHGIGENAFMLRVDGESMKNAGICDKDVIVVEQNAYPNDGDIVVARIDGEEVTVKRFFQKGKEIELRPENEAFSPMFFAPERVEILGSVTGLMRRY